MTFVPSTSFALNAKGGSGRIDGESETFVAAPLNCSPYADNASQESRIIAHTLRGEGLRPRSNSTGNITLSVSPPLMSGSTSAKAHGKKNGTDREAFVFNLRGRDGGSQPEISDLASVRAASGGSSRSYVAQPAVRRLTPVECNILQGFPPTYTHVPGKRRKIDESTARYLAGHGLKTWQDGNRWYTDTPADGPMYRCLGNSMAVPVIAWILERIRMVDEIARQAASTRP